MSDFNPEAWAAEVHALLRAAENPIERAVRVSTERRWARLEAENPRRYRIERRREQLRRWLRAHHLPVPQWMRYARLPLDPRFDGWETRCLLTIPKAGPQ